MGSELEAKSGGLFSEAAEEVVLIFFFVIALTCIAVGLAIFEHAVNDPGQFVRDRLDRFGRVEPGAQAPAESAQGAFAFEGRLGAEPQDVGGTVMSLMRLAADRVSRR